MDYVQALINGIMYGGIYALIGIGYTLIFGTMNQLNLAHGQVIVAGTFVGFALILFFGSNLLVAAIYGLVRGSRSPAYAASKGGVADLTRQMALDWAPDVRVNRICAGVINTPMTAAALADPAFREAAERRHPLGRLGQPDDVANAVLYLASDQADWVTGVAPPVDGGYTAA